MENVSMFWMYIIAMLPDIGDFFSMFMAAFWGGIGIIFFMAAYLGIHCFLEEKNFIQYMKKGICNIVVVLFLGITFTLGSVSFFIPNYQQLAFIVGGHWAFNNEQLQEMPDNVAKVVNGYLEQLNGEMEDKNE